jgi:peptidoglycan/xylan/chitin deacetylase (PgdA/CDA1 family)
MPSKRELAAQLAYRTGITPLLELFPSRSSLLVLNYHRVGDANQTPYDSGTFSCTAAELDWQIGRLKGKFRIVTLEEAAGIVHGRSKPAGTSVLITFDDGYRDNYDEAFPVLQRHGVPAAFFLPTAFVGTDLLPWWDQAAYMVKRSTETCLWLNYPTAPKFELTGADRSAAVVSVLRFFKRTGAADPERFLEALETATGVARPGAHNERCFLNWDEAREMQAAGMSFGSHTHTHEVLAGLKYERQVEELETSREILESRLGERINALAYPIGKPETFSNDTSRALRAAGYDMAFSFYSGLNRPGNIRPFDVLRGSVDSDSRARFRLRTALSGLGRGSGHRLPQHGTAPQWGSAHDVAEPLIPAS